MKEKTKKMYNKVSDTIERFLDMFETAYLLGK